MVEMTASGPFAMGPSQAGRAERRIPRSNFTPTLGSTSSSRAPSTSAAPTRPSGLKRGPSDSEQPQTKLNDEDEYSDPDEGVEIIDMEFVKTMDWAAPESIARERTDTKKKAIKIKTELPLNEKVGLIDVDKVAEAGEVDLANALDLSESEEEEEMEDLVGDFATIAEMEQVCP